ncbi:MAG: membrane dipeptidase [Thermoplasmatales archaeon]
MRFTDLHEDFGIASQKTDIIHEANQSNLDFLKSFDDVLVFGVSFPHIATMNESGASTMGQERSAGKFNPKGTVASWEDLMEQLKMYKYLERINEIVVVRNADDLMKKGVKMLLSLEGTDCLRNPYDLYLLHDLGLRNIGLTWNYDTKFAAAAMSKKDYGLTGFGEELIEIADKSGIIIDLAHASKRTILDTCEVTKKPVINSHSNSKSVYDNIRNLDDESIQAIADTDGVIGVTAIKGTLGEEPSIDDIVTHMEYIGDNFGWRHVALGTDFLGINETPKGFENVLKIEQLAEKLGSRSEQVLWENPLRVIKSILTH